MNVKKIVSVLFAASCFSCLTLAQESPTNHQTTDKQSPQMSVDNKDESCQVMIKGDDRMRYDTKTFTVKKSCATFTINFENAGKLPKSSMGHNVVLAKKSEAQALAMDGMSAGVKNDYLPPEDSRIIVKTAMIGGGEKTSVTFSTDLLNKTDEYLFFCSFPGHIFTMQGTVIVE